MAQKGKWIDGLKPDEAVSHAARRALDVRLDLVWHCLPLAADDWKDDDEPVHQLRVASRRAAATVECYSKALPKRRARWIAKQLDRIRRAANDARDDDVLAQRLDRLADDSSNAEFWAPLRRKVKQLRREAQRPIRSVLKRMKKRRFADRVGELLDRVHWRKKHGPHEPTFAQAAREELGAVLAPFFAAGSGPLTDIEDLHQFRIAGKQVRYAMEVFAAAFPPEFRGELYPRVEELQEKLGALNDHATSVQRFGRWLVTWNEPGLVEPLQRLIEIERDALHVARQDFAVWWSSDRCADLRRRFDDLLLGARFECVA